MVYRFHTSEEDRGRRLDQFLPQQAPDISRVHWKKVIDLGGVHVDGRRNRKCGYTLPVDVKVEAYLDDGPLDPFRLEESHILFQDKHLIAINKPAGVETQPTPARYKGTLFEALQLWLGRDRKFGRKLEIGMAQRLDRDTSGVIVFSIHPLSHKGLTEQMTGRDLQKVYLALVEGCPEPPEGEYRSLLAKDRRTNRMKSVLQGGKEAITRYSVRYSVQGVSLVEVDLITGRTHQIRAHFAEAGCPLTGDVRYGGRNEIRGRRFCRQGLHSWKLSLLHPVHQSPLELTAPLPADLVWIQPGENPLEEKSPC